MKKYIFIAITSVTVLSSCLKEENANEGGIHNDVFTGMIEPGTDTKTTLDGTSIKWDSTDLVYINGVQYSTTPDKDDATKATFERSGFGSITGTYKAFYADGGSTGSWDAGAQTYTLPASYTYRAGKFNMPMYAQSNTTTLAFKNLCGVLKLSLTSSTVASVSKIVISSTGQLNGAFTADESGVLTFSAKTLEDADKMVTVNFSEPQSLSPTATVFYIPVAPGSHILTVKAYNGDSFKSITMKSANTFERKKVYTMSDSKLQAYTGGNPANAR